MYKLEDLRSSKITEVSISHDGNVWMPARPAPYFGWWGFKQRLTDAWSVFTGRADAFIWPGEQ